MSDKTSDKKASDNKTSDKLLPCPFCGGEARLQKRFRKRGYYVICKDRNCGCRTPFYQFDFLSQEELREQAIFTWNTRKPMDRIVERLEESESYSCSPQFSKAIDRAIEIVKEEMS